MQCKSCSEEVSSKFKSALAKNACPYCGEEIMEGALKTVLDELTIIMKDAEPFMQQVEDWLGTNYGLYKNPPQPKLSVDPTDRVMLAVAGTQHNQNQTLFADDNFDENFLQQQIAAAKAKTASFQQKTAVKIPDTKALIQKIQNGGGAAPPEAFVGEDPDYGMIDMSRDSGQPLDHNEAQQMADLLGASYDDNKLEQAIELEKLKKLRTMDTEMSKIRRKE